MKKFKKIMIDVAAILAIGLALSGLMYLSEKAQMEREKHLTAASTRYEIVIRSGFVIMDQGSTPGDSISVYRLKQGQKPPTLILEFKGEPGIKKFAQEHLNEFIRVDGVMRKEKVDTGNGASVEVQVVHVLRLHLYRSK